MKIVVTAPVRTADVGGWTDTWFASHGTVCSVAVEPGVTITLESMPGPSGQVRLLVVATGVDATVDDRSDGGADPLLVAAVRSRTLPEAVRITVESGVPSGSGLGTSASVTVALVTALDAAAGKTRDAHAVACAAHMLETGLGLQSGIQDQLAAAFGGVHRYDVQYPYGGSMARIGDAAVLRLLDERLLTVYLGRPHASSALHDLVIASLEGTDNEPFLGPLRAAAGRAATALDRADLVGYGTALIDATEGMRRLHPQLIGTDADRVIDIARTNGALGWKVNGAGGNGGSIAVLGPLDPRAHAALVVALGRHSGAEVLPTRVARHGVRVVSGATSPSPSTPLR